MTQENLQVALIIIYIIGIVQGVYLSLFLLAYKKNNRLGNRMLSALVLSLTLSVFCQLMYSTALYLKFIYVFLALSGIFFAIGPLLYLYVEIISMGIGIMKPAKLLHFIPFFLNIGFLMFLALFFKDELIIQLNPALPVDPSSISFYPILKTLHMLVYGLLCLRRLAQYANRIKDNYSDIEKINLRWLSKLIFGNSLLLIIIIIMIAFFPSMNNSFPGIDSIMTILITVFIYTIGFQWLRYPDILSQSDVKEMAETIRYKESNLKKEQSEMYLGKLRELMTQKEVYLDCEINLSRLSKLLAVTPHHLSQVINENLNLNFFDFINSYRIERAKEMLKSEKRSDFTILDIAFESGFNNKASFNQAFKKHVQMTPSQFRKISQPL